MAKKQEKDGLNKTGKLLKNNLIKAKNGISVLK